MKKYSSICSLTFVLLSLPSMAETSPSVTNKKIFNVDNAQIETPITHSSNLLGRKINRKKESIDNNELQKPTLKTALPLNTFCGTKLTLIPPNKQLTMEFAEKTALQSFTYNYKHKKQQWHELEKCYTQLGWTSFKRAMANSGNNQSVTDEKLFLKATVDGEVEMLATNLIAPSWKILVPIKVRYENDTHFFIQHLKVKLVISLEKQRLGIDQIIASPTLEQHNPEKNTG